MKEYLLKFMIRIDTATRSGSQTVRQTILLYDMALKSCVKRDNFIKILYLMPQKVQDNFPSLLDNFPSPLFGGLFP